MVKPRAFTIDDQLRFARLSGDDNLIHVDPVAARRLHCGGAIVHGVHLLFWALESSAANHQNALTPHSIQCRFIRPVYLQTETTLQVSQNSRELRLELLVDNETAMDARLEMDPPNHDAGLENSNNSKTLASATDRIADGSDEPAYGSLALAFDVTLAEEMFPNLVRRLSARDLAVLLSLSRLVGIHVPGEHSLFHEFKLQFSTAMAAENLDFKVRKFDSRFGKYEIEVECQGVYGIVTAFKTTGPVEQKPLSELAPLLQPNEFAGQKALLIGGSRGLGEVCAKLLAAGGADVTITFHSGRADAERVLAELQTVSPMAKMTQFDVIAQDNADLPASLQTAPTDVYFFATPFVFSGNRGSFSDTLLESFRRFYVDGFRQVVESFGELGTRRFFFPSTVAIDDQTPDLKEYIQAKLEGEALCSEIATERLEYICYFYRFPRLATDQTVSIFPVDNADPATAVLAALRKFSTSLGPERPDLNRRLPEHKPH